jgi:protein phosphatase PTC2/3
VRSFSANTNVGLIR